MAWSPAPCCFEAIGTKWQIDFPDGLLVSTRKELEAEIKNRIEVFDKHYSRFRADSLIGSISLRSGVYKLPADAELLFSVYEKFYQLTKGLMTPLIGSVLEAAGYDAHYSLQSKPLTAPEKWEKVMTRQGLELTVIKPALLDFGAAGKGYLIDLVAEIIKSAGVEAFCVDAGGDMAYYNKSNETLQIALEHPLDTTQALGVAQITNESICGSAGNRRNWGNFHHIINPETLASPRNILAIWVTAPTTLIADALTTALFFIEPEVMINEYQFEYMIVYSDFSLKRSENFPAEIFTS